MAWSDTSTWNPAKSAYGVPATGPDGLTDKQRDMSTARNPMNSNQLNVVESKEPVKEKEKALPQQIDQKKSEQTQADVQQMRSKIGSAAYNVQGLVNKFLKEGTEQARIKTGITQKFVNGKWVSENVRPEEYDVSAAVREKANQIAQIREAAAPLFEQDATGRWRAKSMEGALKGTMEYDKLDADNKKQVDELIGIASMINEYEKKGEGDSAQAQALRDQLQTLDRNGTVSGMYKAIEEYQKFAGTGVKDSGMKWYGDKGDIGLGIDEILSMDTKELENELRQSVTTGSGIFGGDYETNLKRQIDLESKEAQEAADQETGYRNKLLDASKQYFKTGTDTLMKNSADIQEAFKSVLPQITKELGDDAAGRAAKDFFTQLSSVNAEDFAGVIDNLLNNPDSGLGTDQRKILREMLGDVAGGSGEGKISGWLTELGTQGYITTDKGRVDLNAEQKYKVLTALQQNKPDEVKKVLEEAIGSSEVGAELNQALELTKVGRTAEAAAKFGTAIASSLKGFAKSATEDAVRNLLKISDADWNKLSPEDKSALISRELSKPENKNLVFEDVKAAADTKKKAFDAATAKAREDIEKFSAELAKKKDEVIKVRDKIKAQQGNVAVAVQGYIHNQIAPSLITNIGKYTNYFNMYKDQYAMLGKDEKATYSASTALSFRDGLRNLKAKDPDFWANVYKGPEIENFINMAPDSAMAYALDNGDMLQRQVNTFLSGLISNTNGAMTTLINGSKTLAPKQRAYDAVLANAEAELAKFDVLEKTAKDQTAHLDALGKGVSADIFSPDKISQVALDIGREFEQSGINSTVFQSLGGQFTPSSIADIGGAIPTTEQIAQQKFGTQFGQDSLTPTQISTDFGTPELGVQLGDADKSRTDLQNKIDTAFAPIAQGYAERLSELNKKFPNKDGSYNTVKQQYYATVLADLSASLGKMGIPPHVFVSMLNKYLASLATKKGDKYSDKGRYRQQDLPTESSVSYGPGVTQGKTDGSYSPDYGEASVGRDNSQTGSISDREMDSNIGSK